MKVTLKALNISCRRFSKKGFVLIVTLSLMALLTLIALAMIQVSTIAIRSSERQNDMRLAQANARMALMIALGELQKSAGPDQRVTARADITAPITSSDSSLIRYDTNLQNPYLTAVWDVKPKVAYDPAQPGRTPSHDFKKLPAYLKLCEHPCDSAFCLISGHGKATVSLTDTFF